MSAKGATSEVEESGEGKAIFCEQGVRLVYGAAGKEQRCFYSGGEKTMRPNPKGCIAAERAG